MTNPERTLSSPAAQQVPAQQVPELERVFVALANEHRRRILQRLAAGGAQEVWELRAHLRGLAKSTLSGHLAVLERAGLVGRGVIGRFHMCWLEPSALGRARDWLDGCLGS